MPRLVGLKAHGAPSVTETGATDMHSSRGVAAGVYALQLRRKLLQQQLGVVEDRCKRVAKVVAKKHLAKQLSRHGGDAGNMFGGSKEPAYPVGRRETAANRVSRGVPCRIVSGPGGLPAIGAAGATSARRGDGSDHHNSTLKERGLANKPAYDDRRTADLLTATPFKKGGCIDHSNKKHMLRDKQREIDREADLERKRRPARRALNVRDEVAVMPSAFPDRYLRGEVPCSKHCSAGDTLNITHSSTVCRGLCREFSCNGRGATGCQASIRSFQSHPLFFGGTDSSVQQIYLAFSRAMWYIGGLLTNSLLVLHTVNRLANPIACPW